MAYLSPLDAAFLRMETRRTPMHVGALLTFRLPRDAPRDFVQRLIAQMREKPFMPPPFGARLSRGRLAKLAPSWEETKLDMDYHLRHEALPYPGGERELGKLVEYLHSHPLDRSRPLWEAHVIEGLAPASGAADRGQGRFALYFKAHHCAIDGVGAMRMVQKWLSADAHDLSGLGPWVLAARPQPEAPADHASLWARLKKPADAAAEQARGLRELVKALRGMAAGEDSGTRMALSTQRSLFNVRVSQQRRLGTQILDLNRVRKIAEASGCSVNDVLLAVVGGAVRKYLLEHDAVPERALLASVPMALTRSDNKAGNAVAGFIVPLGTQLDDPARRLQIVNRVTTRSKRELSAMPPAALAQFTLLGLSPLILGQMTGVLPKLPPLFNFVVSNVVLSKHPLYLMGAELEAMYPVSFLFDGYALNITLVGYCDRVAVGFLGCREAIPRLQRLAVYSSDALNELEQAVIPPVRKPRRRKAALMH